MPKKKIKEKVNVMKAEYPKFDFTGKHDARIVNAMIALTATEGWACIRQLLEKQIELLRIQIVDKKGLDGKRLDEVACDVMRTKIEFYQEIIDKPDKLIKESIHEDKPRKTLDPYYDRDDMKEFAR